MNYFDRAAQNAMIENAKYNNTRAMNYLASLATTSAVGTPMGIDGATGRSLVVSGDGIGRTNSIANSSQLAITGAIAVGAGGNAGFSDGKGA